jgi:ABC-type multidrug transport system ATPase subunit
MTRGAARTRRDADAMATPPADAPAIATHDLTKRFGRVIAVEALSMSVARGEIYGFLGRNGAGKTTTIRMLVGLVRPTRGSVSIFGHDVAEHRRRVATDVGVLVETATSYGNLTVLENLEIQRRLTRTPRPAVDRVVALLDLEELAHRRADRLSLGNKQRLGIARAMLARPRLLVLDEPVNGLDPVGIVEIRHLLRRLADDEGVTVFLSSHNLGEVAQLVDRIGVIHRGRLVEEIDMSAASGEARIELFVSDAAAARGVLASRWPLIEVRELAPDRLEAACGDVAPSAVIRTLVEAGIEVGAACPLRNGLETHFLRLTGGEP